MSEKLFSRLYWKPYVLIGVSMILVLISSLLAYLLPWMAINYTGYDLYLFKGIAWSVKLAILVYLFSVYRVFAAHYFPKLKSLCTAEARAVITGYKQTWTRGKQLCPILSYTVEGREYSEALNDAKGSREKDGDKLDKGYTLKLPRKIVYNPQDPRQFYIPGEEFYKRGGAIFRYVLFSVLFFVQLYLNVFMYAR